MAADAPGTIAAPQGTALRRDLDDRAQIHDAVVAFYREIVFDDLLAPVFDEVADVDWALHIPKLIDYWCRVLLGEVGYDGYILGGHEVVDGVEPFRAQHDDRGYGVWGAARAPRWPGTFRTPANHP